MLNEERPAGCLSLSSPSLLCDIWMDELRVRRLLRLRWWTGEDGDGGSASLQVGCAQLGRRSGKRQRSFEEAGGGGSAFLGDKAWEKGRPLSECNLESGRLRCQLSCEHAIPRR
jgi:hypothetical protein